MTSFSGNALYQTDICREMCVDCVSRGQHLDQVDPAGQDSMVDRLMQADLEAKRVTEIGRCYPLKERSTGEGGQEKRIQPSYLSEYHLESKSAKHP